MRLQDPFTHSQIEKIKSASNKKICGYGKGGAFEIIGGRNAKIGDYIAYRGQNDKKCGEAEKLIKIWHSFLRRSSLMN